MGSRSQVITTAGSYTLNAYEAGSPSPIVLKIPRARDSRGLVNAYYYLEYRKPQAEWTLYTTGRPNYTSGVLVHTTGVTPLCTDPNIVCGPDFTGYGGGGDSNLIDTRPNTASGVSDFNDAPLLPGQTYRDTAAGVTITVTAAGPGSATVDVAFSSPSYVVQTTVFPPGAGTVSGGGTYTYGQHVTVTANPIGNNRFMYWKEGHFYPGAPNPYAFDITADRTLEAVFDPGSPCFVSAVTSDLPSPQPVNARLNITATGFCNPGYTPEYKFWLLPPGGAWTEVRGWGNATYAWDTAGRAAGAYTFSVWQRPIGSTASYEGYGLLNFTLTPPAPCTSATLNASPASPQPVNTSINLLASATCGNQPSEFKFWMLPPGGSWTMLRDWGNDNFTWNTRGLVPGTYQLNVWVRVIGSSAPYEAYAQTAYTLNPIGVCTSVALTANPGSPQARGTTIGLHAAATCTGGVTPEYKFWWRPAGGGWSLLRDYGDGPDVNWITTGLSSGSYELNVWARGRNSDSAYESYVIRPFTLN